MKKLICLLCCIACGTVAAADDLEAEASPTTALLLIDIQDFYFPEGAVPLVEPEAAAEDAARVLSLFRSTGRPVIHVRHDFEPGGSIHATVAPIDGEKVFTKSEVSCFVGTDVLANLRKLGVERLVLAGMQTHMCLEAATRAAHDLGFECIVVADACATRDLTYGGTTVTAADVQASTLATLDRSYARVVDTETLIAEMSPPAEH